MQSLIQKINHAISSFNKYKGAEAKAELIELNKDSFKVLFSGHMCFACGHHDYFDDLRIELEVLGVKTKAEIAKESKEGTLVFFTIL